MTIKLKISIAFIILLLLLVSWANLRGKALPTDFTVDKILIEKKEHRLTVFHQNIPVKVYQISLGRTPVGRKEREGDNRTPEGLYSIDAHKKNSSFYRALHISYPNSDDVRLAHAKGIDPGGNIMIHGMRNGFGWLGKLHTWIDWTAGCVAVTDWEIEELWDIPEGTLVEIKP